MATVSDDFILVLDDYHVIDTEPIDHVLNFLLDYLPPQMHIVITTREDPQLPLAKLRARGQLTELRSADLRFISLEAAGFLNQVMELNLSEADIIALEARTEGWIAGLQLAAISMQGRENTADFIQSFTGSHHFVLDYLVEEVLHQQSEHVQTFLLQTSILDRLCGSLCNALLLESNGQETLESIGRANLFLIPLDNERRWYRYHHLFADLLRQRLQQSIASSVMDISINELHIRASQWYEDNGLDVEAFQHAVAANDIDRATHLIEGREMPLHFRGTINPVVNWISSLPTAELDARPTLWVMHASALTIAGREINTIEEKLLAAEAAMQDIDPDDKIRDLIGHIAAIRAMLAAPNYAIETMLAESNRALEFLKPDNFPVRTMATWVLGLAYQFQGDRASAKQVYTDAIAISSLSGNSIVTMAGMTCLGQLEEGDNNLHIAQQHYQDVIKLAGEPPLATACEAYLGMARLSYQWNDLDAAQTYAEQALKLARQVENIDTPVECEIVLARLQLAQDNIASVSDMLAKTEQLAHQRNFTARLPEVIAAQILTLIQQDKLDLAVERIQDHDLPMSQARIYLAQDDPASALEILEPLHQQMEEKGWQDERLKVMVLQAIAYYASNDTDQAVQVLQNALRLAESSGFIRIFVDEGAPMAELLSKITAQGILPDYTAKLLSAFEARDAKSTSLPSSQPLVEPLSERELEILQLIDEGLSNREISDRLFIALSTVKGHNRNIFGKLSVQRRTEALARARELGLL